MPYVLRFRWDDMVMHMTRDDNVKRVPATDNSVRVFPTRESAEQYNRQVFGRLSNLYPSYIPEESE